MGLMEIPRAEPGQLIITPHPMLLDGQRNVVWEARAGESLYVLLMRNVPELDGQPWAVSVDGVDVERHLWHTVCPKQGQIVEVRGGVGKAALMVVAMIALTYFTFGLGAATAGMWGAAWGASAGGLAGAVLASGMYMAGSMLINKVLGPKPPKASSQSLDSVYSLSGARNQIRQHEPIPLLFGRVRIAPDLLSQPYSWYQGNDQYLGMVLCAGVNVGRLESLYNGDTLLSSYDGARVFHSGYSQMQDQKIPLYGNADVIEGAQLLDTGSDPKHTPGAWVERTSSADSVRLVVGLEYQLYDKSSKGKDKNNTERVEIQYRATGTTGWQVFGNYTINSSKTKAYRAGYSKDVARGQYDVRVRTAGLNTNGSGAQAAFTWTTLTSVQVDEGDYTGLSRTGIELKATGQLNGSPNELRAVGYADPVPVWDGSAWSTAESSNPGAQILAYARGINRDGRLLGGLALDEEQIDVDSLKAFMLHCAANGYTYDNYIKDARNHEQILSAIALAGFGQITWAGGRLGVVWAAQDQPLSGVVNMGTIKKGQFQVDYSLSNAADGIEYTYIDGEIWEAKTLRVPAPGVTTMLNPAQVTGEGVTTEQHAARMARWHLGQSLYQYKDISYSTDIEHLSYQRMSVLAMQHDMTQWGFGGRVSAAVDEAGKVTLTLDEEVPAPASGNAYIGLRIPGERVYRVLRVAAFSGVSKQITLTDAWPIDAALPGNTIDNPAHDTLWIYDFKQTPGLRVRVVSVEPESDLKGASVHVVAEGPEFWQYVLTGHYIPSPNASSLQTRPTASGLKITEQQVVQGNTTFTELTATFDVSGPAGNIVVRAAAAGEELEEVAQTQTRTATWRIPRAGVYNIVVRAFSPEGEAGVAVSANYITAGADVSPVLVDLFDVAQRSGGVRLYTWGWLGETIQSPDFAGVEIRYVAGTPALPDWDAMTPVGETGYHTAPFEAVMPQAGQWTFACRSRNTAGVLSTGMRVTTRMLAENLGEKLEGIGESIGVVTQQQIAQQVVIDKEVRDRTLGDLQTAAAAAADATNKANNAVATAKAYADGAMAQFGDILDADEWASTKNYPKGDFVKAGGKLYRSLVASNLSHAPAANSMQWELVGNYSSVGEAVAASISMSTENANDISVESTRVDGVLVRLPADGGRAASTVQLVNETTARASADTALGQRVDAVQVDLVGKASTGAVASLSGRVDTMDGKVISQGEAIVSATSKANSSANARPNILANPFFTPAWAGAGVAGWIVKNWVWCGGISQTWEGYKGGGSAILESERVAVTEGVRYTASADIINLNNTLYSRLLLIWYNGDTHIDSTWGPAIAGPTDFHIDGEFDFRKLLAVTGTAPTGATHVVVRGNWDFDSSASSYRIIGLRRPKLENGSSPTPFSEDAATRSNASATLALNTRTTELEAASSATLAAVSAITKPGVNMLVNPTFDNGLTNWGSSSPSVQWEALYGNYAYHGATGGGVALEQTVSALQNLSYVASVDIYRNSSAGNMRIELVALDSGGAVLFAKSGYSMQGTLGEWQRTSVGFSAPAGTAKLRVRLIWESTTANNSVRRVKLEQGKIASPFTNERTDLSNAQAVVSLSSRATMLEATASTSTAAIAALGGSSNLFENSDFSSGASRWYTAWNPGGWSLPLIDPAGDNWRPDGGISIGGTRAAGAATNEYGVIYQTGIQAVPGKRYIVSGFTANHRCTTRLAMRFLDRNGKNLSEPGTAWSSVDGNGGNLLANWEYRWLSSVAPAGTAVVDAGVWVTGNGGAGLNPYFWFTRPMLEQASESQAQPSPWAPGGNSKMTAQAITTHTADISAVSGRVAAKITNALDVNGNISGTVSENDGTRSSFSILASIFRVISSASSGLEWQNGYLRAYSSAIQLVLGINFGSSSNLCFWYGPNVGATNCTKSNGTIWFDNTGSAYFGGSLSAGTLKNAVQTTTTVVSGTSLLNGPFTTNGGARTVTLSFNRSHMRTNTKMGNQGFVAGSGANTATVRLYRAIGNSAEVLWQTLNVAGGVTIENEFDGPDSAYSGWGGAATYNDSSSSSQTVTYRAEIALFTEQAVTHQSGSFNGQSISQNLSIISIE